MNRLLIGNIIALLASVMMVLAGLQKAKKKILITQIIQLSLSVISNLVLGGYTGAAINTLNCVRDVLCYKEKMGTVQKVALIIIATVLSLAFNNMGWIGLFPLIAAIVYLIFLNTKDVVKFKLLICFSISMWLVYDLSVKSYTASAFDVASLVANTVIIIALLIKKKSKKTEVQ